MNKKDKRILIPIFSIIIIIWIIVTVVVWFYAGSDSEGNSTREVEKKNEERLREAEKKRDERLKYLDEIKRTYIIEGVYKYNRQLTKTNFIKDKFGNTVTNNTIDNVVYEVSFTSNKLVILNPKTNIKEEIIFKNKYEIAPLTNENCIYYFYVDSWKIQSQISGRLIKDILPTITTDDRKTIGLDVVYKEVPKFCAIGVFHIPKYDGSSDKDPPFIEPAGVICIKLDELVYTYNRDYPDYVRLAKYRDFEYDLNYYLK